jgi:hypothetical protein
MFYGLNAGTRCIPSQYEDKSVFDKLFHRYCVKELDKSTHVFWSRVMERLVLGFSDQQLVTGTAMLLVAFIRVPASQGRISVYHFTIITDLAWYSANTHVLTLFVLKEYFRATDHKALRFWRMLGMIAMALFFFAGEIVTGHKYWYGQETRPENEGYYDFEGVRYMLPQFDGFGCPVECIMKDLYKNIGGEPRGWTAINIMLLCWGYGIALTPLFKPTREGWRKVKLQIRAWYKVYTPESDIPRKLYHAMGTGVSILYDLVRSIFLHTLFSFAWFFYLVAGMVGDREDGQDLLGPDQYEDKWAFGQLVPLLLIFLPILAAMEAYCGKFLSPERANCGRSKGDQTPFNECGKRRTDGRTVEIS